MADQQNVTKPTLDSVLRENQKLKQMLLTAKTSLESYRKSAQEEKALNEKLSSRVAAIEMERRKERISSILQGAYKEEEFTARVDTFAKSGLPIEDIQSIVAPLIEQGKAAVEQAKQVEVQQQAEQLAKNASKNVTKQHESKVAMKNAAQVNEQTDEPQIPAWVKARDYLFNGAV